LENGKTKDKKYMTRQITIFEHGGEVIAAITPKFVNNWYEIKVENGLIILLKTEPFWFWRNKIVVGVFHTSKYIATSSIIQ
jgi:hypothetical protein